MRSRRCHILVTALHRLETGGEAAAWLPGGTTARHYVSRQLRKVRRQSRHSGRLGARQLHRLRSRVRGLRYACEFLAPKLPGQAAAYVEALAALQQTLGRLNDSYVVHRLAQSLPGANNTSHIKAVAARHRPKLARLRARLHDELKGLQDLKRAT
jgi:CHAD domain-containing protein